MTGVDVALSIGSVLSGVAGGLRLVEWLGKVPPVRRWLRRRPLRYLSSVQGEFEAVAKAPLLRMEPAGASEGGAQAEPGEPRGRPLREFVPELGAVHLLGSAGSGKSWSVGRYVYDLARAEWTRRMGLDSARPTLPVYARASHEHLLDALGRFLLRHGFYRDVPPQDRVRELLARGGWTIILDDVHLHLEDDKRMDTLGLSEILDYRDRNRILLAGRPHVARNPRGVSQITMVPPDGETRSAVVRHHLAEGARAEYVEGVIARASRATALYGTPQALRLVTEAVEQDGRLPDRLIELFGSVHRARVAAAQDRSASAPFDLGLSRAVLGALAYDRLASGAYRFSAATARQTLGAALDEMGAAVAEPLTASGAVDVLLSDGYLMRDGEELRFEHDRWQEYFAAIFIVERQIDVGALESATAFAGVSRLVTSAQPAVVPSDVQTFWAEFWDRVAERNVGLALELLDIAGPPPAASPALPAPPGDWLLAGYGAFLDRYKELLAHHTGPLRARLPPRTSGEVGLIVARGGAATTGPLFRGHWLGFRPVEKGDDAVVVVPSAGDGDPRHLRGAWGARGVTSWVPEPGVESPPMRAALRVWAHYVDGTIRERRLVEPWVLVRERVYYDLVAVAARVGLRPVGQWAPFSLEEADALVGAREVGGALSEGATLASRWSRRVRPGDLDRDYAAVREAAEGDGLITPPLWPPLPPAPEFGEARRPLPVAQALDFQRRAYEAARELASLNLPTLEALMHDAMGFPMRVALRDRSAENVGLFDRVTFSGVRGQSEPVVVESPDEAELAALRLTLDARGEVESSATWPGTIEPLRRKAYSVLTEAWKGITGSTGRF